MKAKLYWWALLIVSFCATVAGCATKPITPTDHTTQLTTPLTAAKATVVQGHQDLKVKNYDAVDKDFTVIDQHLDAGIVAAHEVGTIDLRTQQQLADAQTTVKKLNSDFFSPRQKRDFWGFVIIGSIVGVGLGVLKFAAGSNPITGVMFHIIAAVATGGISLVMHGTHWLVSKIVGLFKGKSAATSN